MKIQVSIQSYRFNKRLCWMLSSILQQVPRQGGRGLPEIEVRVSFLNDNETGQNVRGLLGMFQGSGLNVKTAEFAGRESFKYRGNVRNSDLKDIHGRQCTDADWVLWADSDMVYAPTFFGELGHLLRTSFKGNPHCLHSARKSTFLEETEALIGQYTYPCVIPDAYALADKLKAVKKSDIGAGYCQIANVKNLFDNHNGVYAKKVNDHDWDTQGQKAKSDIVFRHMLGAEKIPLPIQIHLQHVRSLPDERDC